MNLISVTGKNWQFKKYNPLDVTNYAEVYSLSDSTIIENPRIPEIRSLIYQIDYTHPFSKKKKVASVVSAYYTIKYGTLDYNKKNLYF